MSLFTEQLQKLVGLLSASPQKSNLKRDQMKKYSEVLDLVKSSLQFTDLKDSEDAIDFSEVTEDNCFHPQISRPPLLTFSDLLAQRECPQQQEPDPKPLREPNKHCRGPSKIKDILSSLKAGVLTDLQRIVNELFQEENEPSNDEPWSQRISFAQVDLFQESNEPGRFSQNQDGDADYRLNTDHANQADEEEFNHSENQVTFPTMNTMESDQKELDDVPVIAKEIPQRKKRRHYTKTGYRLDVIEEQSYECVTPEKLQQENFHSVPCFNIQQYSPMFFSQTLEQDTEQQDIIDHLNAIQLKHTSDEDAVLQSWNNLCTRIIQKNHLPLQLNVDRIKEQSRLRNRENVFHKLAKAKKRMQFLNKFRILTQNTSGSCYPSHTDEERNRPSEKSIVMENPSSNGDAILQFSPQFSEASIQQEMLSSEGLRSFTNKAQKENRAPQNAKTPRQPISFLQYKNNLSGRKD